MVVNGLSQCTGQCLHLLESQTDSRYTSAGDISRRTRISNQRQTPRNNGQILQFQMLSSQTGCPFETPWDKTQ